MRALVILKGEITIPKDSYDLVCCADGAYALVKDDLRVDLVVGDFDTLGAPPQGVSTVTVPCKKDFTDAELALREVVRCGATDVDIIGATGGDRVEHAITNLFLLPIAKDLGVKARILYRGGEMFVAEGCVALDLSGVRTVSLAPVYGKAHILSTKGLLYEAHDLDLTPDSTIGVSNEPTAPTGELVTEGRVLVILSR